MKDATLVIYRYKYLERTLGSIKFAFIINLGLSQEILTS